MTHWTNHAIWWHIYPLGFSNSPIHGSNHPPAHRLPQLINWLDYTVELGVNGLSLGPIFSSETHGYDTVDHFQIDPRLGSIEDFQALIAACTDRGLHVILDGVFSHVGLKHPSYQQALTDGKDSPAAQLFAINWSHGTPTPAVFEGHKNLVRFNHQSQQTIDYTAKVMTHWLQYGIAGWRLDAAYSVAPEFWAQVLSQVRPHFPNAWFVGEVIHGDYSAFTKESTVDSLTQYELWKAIWSSIHDQNFFELDWCLNRHNTFLETFIPHTFIGNHDVTRIASKIGRSETFLAMAILLTTGGIPAIYYGDEQGFTGIKEERVGGDDAIRPAYPQTPEDLMPGDPEMYRAYQDLIGIRRRNPWLVQAQTKVITLENKHYVYQSCAPDGENFLETHLSVDPVATVTIKDQHGTVLWQH